MAASLGTSKAPPGAVRGLFVLVDSYEAFKVGLDVVSMLALFEHIPTEEQPAVVEACYELLVPGGRVVITVPSPAVDPMLDAMVKLRVLDGIEHEQHYGFKPADLPPLFEQGGFSLSRSYRFQLGLNNVFVFAKPLS
jgi:SAM-dependent methyltransferase